MIQLLYVLNDFSTLAKNSTIILVTFMRFSYNYYDNRNLYTYSVFVYDDFQACYGFMTFITMFVNKIVNFLNKQKEWSYEGHSVLIVLNNYAMRI